MTDTRDPLLTAAEKMTDTRFWPPDTGTRSTDHPTCILQAAADELGDVTNGDVTARLSPTLAGAAMCLWKGAYQSAPILHATRDTTKDYPVRLDVGDEYFCCCDEQELVDTLRRIFASTHVQDLVGLLRYGMP